MDVTPIVTPDVEPIAEPDADIGTDVAARLWAGSGCAWLTDPSLGTPVGVVRRALGLVERLDADGAGLAEVAGAHGLGLLAARAALMGLPAASRVSAGGASRFVRAADGWVVVSLARDDDVELVPAWLDVAGVSSLDPWPEIDAAAGSRSRADLVERAALLGLPAGAVGETGDRRAVLAERLGDTAGRSVEGALVVNLSALWAGPLCADVLARLGARVLTVESVRRPDGGRAARGLFEALHGRTESVALELADDRGQRQLAELVAQADVVIEGSRPRALAQMGIDAPAVVAGGGPQVWISITGHGREGERGRRVGFGDDAAGAGGLVGWVDDEPRFVADAIADPLTGLTAAVATVDLLERGGRWLVDVALARTARSIDADWHHPGRGLPPRRRPCPPTEPGCPLPLGRDTDRVLTEFDISRGAPVNVSRTARWRSIG